MVLVGPSHWHIGLLASLLCSALHQPNDQQGLSGGFKAEREAQRKRNAGRVCQGLGVGCLNERMQACPIRCVLGSMYQHSGCLVGRGPGVPPLITQHSKQHISNAWPWRLSAHQTCVDKALLTEFGCTLRVQLAAALSGLSGPHWHWPAMSSSCQPHVLHRLTMVMAMLCCVVPREPSRLEHIICQGRHGSSSRGSPLWCQQGAAAGCICG